VGNEVLLGETVDTNGAWLSRELAALGLPVVNRETVGDRKTAIQDGLTRLVTVADVVLVSGGLGPTPDDVTLDAVAERLGLELVEDPELRAELEARFRARGYDALPVPNLRQARVPRGGVVLGNPLGTAPALVLRHEETPVVLLPGVPRELRMTFTDLVRPWLLSHFAGRLQPVRHRDIHTTGVPESVLTERLEGVSDLPEGVELASLPSLSGVSIRLTVRGEPDPTEAERRLQTAAAALDPVVGPFRFEAESGDLVEAVAEALLGRSLTVATAESCTGGLVAKRLTDRPGSADYFLGGVVAYSDAAKVELIGVEPGLLTEHGAVSRPVAEALARGAAQRFGADAGIGITGIAGPGGATAEKPVGTVWYAVHVNGQTEARLEQFPGDRAFVRERSGQAALALLLRLLEDS
jgi:nicotinamide-nucleotide amidase